MTRVGGRVHHRIILTGLLALVWMVGLAPAAHAHAELLGSTPEPGAVLPQAPASVELRFNEPVQLVAGGTRLIDSSGSERAVEAVTRDSSVEIALPDDLADGGYALAYRVVSADGHPVTGALVFSIGAHAAAAPTVAQAGDGSVEAVLSALTAAQYTGLLLLAGLLLFAAVVDSRGDPGRLPLNALAVAATSSVLLIPAAALRVGGLPPAALVDPGRWVPLVGQDVVVAAGLVLVAGGAALAVRAFGRRRLAALPAVLALVAPALVGHTRTVQPAWLMVAADLGHLIAGACWFGGLAGLLLAVSRTRVTADAHEAAALVSRFSRLALPAVAVLALSGTTMAILVLPSPAALIDTGYGHALLVKLGVLTVPVAIAAWNRFRLLPLIGSRPERRAQWRTLRNTLGYEAAALVAVLAITGVLTNSSPVPDPAGIVATSPVAIEAGAQNLTVTGSVEPGRVGSNRLRFRLAYNGREFTGSDVTVAAWLPARALGPLPAAVNRDGDGYLAELVLPAPGTYRVDVAARVDTFTKPIVSVQLIVP